MNRGEVMPYYLADGLGTVRALADSTGTVDQTYQYSVFGEITRQRGSVENPSTSTAHEWEPEAGLYRHRARWYDAGVVRFLSEDPIRPHSIDADLLRYGCNSPATYTGPVGLEATIDQCCTPRFHKGEYWKCVAISVTRQEELEAFIVGGLLLYLSRTRGVAMVGLLALANEVGYRCRRQATHCD